MPEAYYAHQALSAWKKIALTHRLNTPVVAAEGPQCMMVSVHGSSVHCDDFKALCVVEDSSELEQHYKMASRCSQNSQ